MDKKPVCIPLDQRRSNKIDELKTQINKLTAEIAEIQKKCKHDFRLTSEPLLQETLVKGVFWGAWMEKEWVEEREPPIKRPEERGILYGVGRGDHVRWGSKITCPLSLTCTTCNTKTKTDTNHICPKCLSQMSKAQPSNFHWTKYWNPFCYRCATRAGDGHSQSCDPFDYCTYDKGYPIELCHCTNPNCNFITASEIA